MQAPQKTSEEFGAFAYWSEDSFSSFQLLRLIEQAGTGGAELAEVHQVARRLEPGDGEGWRAGFGRLAEQLEARARRAADAGHAVSARDAWWRAASYHHTSGFFLAPGDARQSACTEARRRCFSAGAAAHDALIEQVEIPFAPADLPGYVFAPPAGRANGSGVLLFGGADAVSEELFFHLGRPLADRGFTVLAFDGPGQGEALRRGVRSRPDFEVAVTAAFDALQARPEVDPARIGLVGQSLGGLYAVRAAAFEPRLRAVVVWGALWDLRARVQGHIEAGGLAGDHYLEHFRVLLGLESTSGVLDALTPFTLDGVTDKIRTQTLVLHGEDDLLCPVADAIRVHQEAPAGRVTLQVYPSGGPGCTHCQIDALSLAQADISDWLEDELGGARTAA